MTREPELAPSEPTATRLVTGKTEDKMDSAELQARATIAAALIMSRAVQLPTIPSSGEWSGDTAAIRLRDLTDYVYQMITSPRSR